MIDLEKEQLYSLRYLAEQLPKLNGKARHPATLRRWVEQGSHGVRMEAVIIAGVWHSTIEAFRRFVEAQNSPGSSSASSPSKRMRNAQARLKRHRIGRRK